MTKGNSCYPETFSCHPRLGSGSIQHSDKYRDGFPFKLRMTKGNSCYPETFPCHPELGSGSIQHSDKYRDGFPVKLRMTKGIHKLRVLKTAIN